MFSFANVDTNHYYFYSCKIRVEVGPGTLFDFHTNFPLKFMWELIQGAIVWIVTSDR